MKIIQTDQILELWRDVFSILRSAAPVLSVLVTFVTLIEALSALAVLYAIKVLVDSIGAELSSSTGEISADLVYTLSATGAAFLLAAFFQNLATILRLRQGFLVSDHIDNEIHDRAISVSLRFYESPEYYDALERAREGGSRRPAQIVANFVTTLRAAITIVGIIGLIWSIEYRLIPALLLPIGIALLIRLYFARKLFNWRMTSAQKERRAGYLDFVMTHASHAKDLRINGIGSYFRDKYSELRKELRSGEIKIEQTRLWSEFSIAALGVLVFIAASSWLLYDSLDLVRPIGDVVLFVLLLRRAQVSGNELVGNISKIVDDHLYLRRLFDFLLIPPQTALPTKALPVPKEVSTGLELSNVSFRYDGSNEFVLKNVSLELAPSRIVALVGENGSGKTTLIKLLTRLYDPTEGHVTLEGIDVRELNPREFRSCLSVVFQDYAMYADTVSANIRFGEIDLEASQEHIEAAARNAEASDFIEALPQSYDTPLTKIFDNGRDLSIGQWQRLAIARALYAESRFLILDEPTSSMDAKAELELFEDFRSRIGSKGALIISHRLSTVRQADYIYVLATGSIIEQGTHDELISANGSYAQLFEKQARNYQ